MKKNLNQFGKSFSLTNASWITDFWFAQNQLFVTESLFDEELNLLGVVSPKSLTNNLSFKNPQLNFLNHPNPITTSALLASQSEVHVLEYTKDFIYQVFSFGDKLYVAYLKNNKVKGYTKIYDQNFEEVGPQIEGYLILGELLEELVFIKVQSRMSFVAHNGKWVPTKFGQIKKIINFPDFDLVVTHKHEIYQVWDKKHVELIYSSAGDLEVSKFNDTMLVISEQTTQQTWVVNLENQAQKIILANEYFYRLTSINKQVLVGKPLYLNQKYEDYSLPLRFIF